MIDRHGVLGYLISGGNLTLGVVTQNPWFIAAGILSGIAVTLEKIFSMYLKWKQYKKGKDVDRIDS